MTPALLLPGALAALLSLVIPLVIHIARRSEQVPTDFAALRWLRQRPRPRSRLRFDEWVLLFLRLVLLALVALSLAHPVLFGAGDRTPVVALVPGVDPDRAPTGDVRSVWLAPGFPAIDQPPPSGPWPVASLIRQLDAETPAGVPLTIITPQLIEGADADRLRLSRKLDWRIVSGAMPAPRIQPAAMPLLSIRHDAQHRSGVRYLRAAALAWQPAGRAPAIDIALLEAPLPDRSHILIWLSDGTMPDRLTRWITQGGTALVAADMLVPTDKSRAAFWRDPLGAPLVEALPMERGRLLRFTRALTPAAMPALLEADFPAHLRPVLSPAPPPPARVAAADYAPLTGGRIYAQPPQDMRPWIAVLIALLLIAERWLATRRKRSISP
jgi:hypothetical protein